MPDSTIDQPPSDAAAQRVYFISGLGADERIFQWLDCEGIEPIHIHWITPERGEAIGDYARRLSAQIDDPEPVLVGLSFGGLIAVEMAKQMPTQAVILLSSVKHKGEVPFYFKLFRWAPVHRIFPFKTLLWGFYWLAYWLFDPEGDEQRILFKLILQETDPRFLKWALHKVVTWRNNKVVGNLTHIHGKRDRIFPHRFVTPDHSLDPGGHLVVMNRPGTVSELIASVAAPKTLPLAPPSQSHGTTTP